MNLVFAAFIHFYLCPHYAQQWVWPLEETHHFFVAFKAPDDRIRHKRGLADVTIEQVHVLHDVLLVFLIV